MLNESLLIPHWQARGKIQNIPVIWVTGQSLLCTTQRWGCFRLRRGCLPSCQRLPVDMVDEFPWLPTGAMLWKPYCKQMLLGNRSVQQNIHSWEGGKTKAKVHKKKNQHYIYVCCGCEERRAINYFFKYKYGKPTVFGMTPAIWPSN